MFAPDSDALKSRLDVHAASVHAAGRRWAAALTPADLAHLSVAFHRAESLAEAALVAAIGQLGAGRRAELLEQLEDERRHVAVFASWFLDGAPPVSLPDEKQRPEAVWFAMLACNELAGFCQFEMLAAILHDPTKVEAVRAVAADERRHIARLVRWLAPERQRPAQREVDRFASRFAAHIDARMQQFLPRDELGPLRSTVGSAVADLITELLLSEEAASRLRARS
ncbi:MAG: hypothetical protein IV100_26460 [Myxococcales bacterium]|nr:hypothetical protein [Myxococcales bacterium]